MTDLDESARLAIARRIAADHPGISFFTAKDMVTDVARRGAASPHAAVVSDAAWAIIQPVIEPLAKWAADSAAALQKWATMVGEQMRPLIDALAARGE